MQQLTQFEKKTINSLAYYFSLILKKNVPIRLNENEDNYAPFNVLLNELFAIITTEFADDKPKTASERFAYDVTIEIGESVPNGAPLYVALDTETFITYATDVLYEVFCRESDTKEDFLSAHPNLLSVLATIQRTWLIQKADN